ncbi:MAG: hypothetical protein Kow00121_54460 [Elainellaceae cyanobacterium]
MVEEIDLNTFPENNLISKYEQIVGEFQFEARRYLILAPAKDSSKIPWVAFSNSLEPFTDCINSASKISFEIDGCSFKVIEIKNASASPEVTLAKLLTGRELQTAALVASGRSNKQIAKQLHISECTVATYIRRIFFKLGVDSRAAMVYRCAPLLQQLNTLADF